MNKLAVAASTACAAVMHMAQAGGGDYTIDPTHTFVSFEIVHLGTSTQRVRFDRKEGQVQFDRAARTGRVEISVDMNSVNSGVPSFDDHLKSRGVFDTARFPSARFVGSRFSFDGDRVNEVAGTLTMRGQTHPVRLKATRFNCYLNPIFRREVCGGDFEAVIRRSLWGVNDGLPALAPDDVRLVVQVEAIGP